jgi:hypothetical protein
VRIDGEEMTSNGKEKLRINFRRFIDLEGLSHSQMVLRKTISLEIMGFNELFKTPVGKVRFQVSLVSGFVVSLFRQKGQLVESSCGSEMWM